MKQRHLSIALCLAASAIAVGASAQPTQVSRDGRHLLESDGDPFIWIGDTAWELFHKLDRDEAIYYLDKRASQGFTVIQAVVLAEDDGLRKPNAYGELPFHHLDPTRPNEAYFQHVDFVVNAAAERGLAIGMLPTWGDKVISNNPGAGPVIFNAANARVFAAFLGERYRHSPIVWILGGDRNVDHPEARAVWNSMAEALDATSEGKQLITYHPRGNSSSAEYFHEAAWLDFNMYQTGHQARAVPVYQFAKKAAEHTPRKPFVEGEPAYEDIPIRFWEYMDFSKQSHERVPHGVLNADGTIRDRDHFEAGFVTAHDVRRHAYWNLLSGAAGYTYGNNAVWQMFEPGSPVMLPTVNGWRDALDSPGAYDMKHLRELWSARPFSYLRPAQALIVGENPEGPSYRVAALAADGSFAIVYLPDRRSVSIDATLLRDSELHAWWFNPRTGSAQRQGMYPKSNDIAFSPPQDDSGGDWILVIDGAGAGLPPGS